MPAPLPAQAPAVLDAFYALWDTTGGMPPAACRAPTKPGIRARRVEHQERGARRRLHWRAKTATDAADATDATVATVATDAASRQPAD